MSEALYATSASLTRSHLRSPDDEIRPWQPGDGDSRCQECDRTYVPWFTDNWLWNHVIGGPSATDDPGGYLCPRCFMVRCEQVYPGLVWRTFPEWSPTRDTTPVACGAQYGQNPEVCYHEHGHPGPHSNRYGTTWTSVTSPVRGTEEDS